MTTESAGAPDRGRVLARAGTTEPAAPAFPPPRSADRPTAPAGRPAPGPAPVGGLLLTADCLAAAGSAAAVGVLTDTAATLLLLVPGLLLALLLNAHAGRYRPVMSASAFTDLPGLLGSAALAWCTAAAVLAAVLPREALGWAALAALVLLHTATASLARGAVHTAGRAAARRRPRSTLVVGSGPAPQKVARTLYDHPEYGLRPIGLVPCGPGQETQPDEPPLPRLTSSEDITRAVIQNAVQDAVFTSFTEHDPRSAELVSLLTAQGCTVWQLGTEPGAFATGPGVPAGDLWGFGCRRVEPPRQGRGHPAKRLLDLVGAGTGLLLLAPLLLGCALAVRCADGPGVLFRQERIGRDGRPFVLLKFRTLRPVDAYESATLWNVAHDRRMSAAGRFLRRTSLDELPQLWNVLRGDMSLVGPRPERPYFVNQFSQSHEGYAHRHRMPVGITGLAQVNGLRGDTSIEDRARFDNHYIDSWSVWQDVRILLRTAGSVFRLGGS